jgi:hypothetical protein
MAWVRGYQRNWAVVAGALLTGLFLVLPAFPGLALSLVVFGINLLGDGLTTAWNPRLRRGRGPGPCLDRGLCSLAIPACDGRSWRPI